MKRGGTTNAAEDRRASWLRPVRIGDPRPQDDSMEKAPATGKGLSVDQRLSEWWAC